MKSLYLTESERQQILNLHKSRMLLKEDPTTPAAGTTPAASTTTTPAAGTPAAGTTPAASTTTTPATGTPAAVTNYTVQQLQQLLISKGYNVGSADNQLGKGTLAQIEAAVKAAKSGTPAAPAATTSLPAPVIAPLAGTQKTTGLQTDASGKVTGGTTTTIGGNTPTTDAGSMTT
jgi:hypothetical protein